MKKPTNENEAIEQMVGVWIRTILGVLVVLGLVLAVAWGIWRFL